jgi:peroxiredoxin
MKKTALLFFFLPLLAAAQTGEKGFKLAGKVKDLAFEPEWVYLQYRVDSEWKKDSVQTKDGKYEFEGKIAEPVLGRISVQYRAGADGKKLPSVSTRDGASLFLQEGKMKVVSVDSFSNISVEGSVAHDEYKKLKKSLEPYTAKLKPLYDKYREQGKAKDGAGQEITEKEIDAIETEMRESIYGDYARKNPGSPIAVYALDQYAGWEINPDKVDPVFNALSETNKNYPSAISLKENIEIAKKTAIGKLAMEFTQNDTLGNPIKLSSFKGRYLLVDFWASWCGPCRAENPNVVRVFNKYKDRNFHILGVSLDRPNQKERWLKAIHDDKLDWTQVSDLKFWDNEVAKQYGIKAIPQNLLLDPEGRIIAKNLKGDELDQKLGEAMAEKKGF